MLFNSWQFLLFFPLTTFIYFILPHRFRWALLLAASCYFYMAFVPWYILILFFTIVIDYIAGIQIEKAVGKRRRSYLILSLAANIGILAIFKYYNFFMGDVNAVAHFFHWNYSASLLSIILPIGLSFHTFQAMSYTIEVYRGNQPAERHFGIYALYVMFYPQLVAGPIERPQNMLHQFREEHKFDYAQVVSGLQLMVWGFFKKVVVADRAAILVDAVYNRSAEFTGPSLVLATILFGFQIYCDFSAYTDIARGAARVLGFRLMENFNRPYAAVSVADFWKRWHISLSSWFRDYLYIPLGGNRVSRGRWYFNMWFVFLVSGFWHGANWTFIIWGALHGTYLVVSRITEPLRQRVVKLLSLHLWPRMYHILQIGVTFSLISFAWIFFRAATLSQAWFIASHLFSGWSEAIHRIGSVDFLNHAIFLGETRSHLLMTIALLIFLELVQWYSRVGTIREQLARQPVWFRWALYSTTVWTIIFLGKFGAQKFIYFVF